jgi:hypothetical protein
MFRTVIEPALLQPIATAPVPAIGDTPGAGLWDARYRTLPRAFRATDAWHNSARANPVRVSAWERKLKLGLQVQNSALISPAA